jgi:diguanylate cyclase (GGDEF)-like protein
MLLAQCAETHRVEDRLLSAIARLGALALGGTPLGELREHARRTAAELLDAKVAVDRDALLVNGKVLTPAELHFLEIVGQILTAAAENGRARLHDALTGLPSRAVLEDRIAAALAGLRRGPWRVALLCVNIDRLKVLNETLGHRAGDELLRAVGPRLLEVLRPGDMVVRFGGGFTVLCEGIADERHAVRIAERIVDAFEAPFAVSGRLRHVTASVGVALGDASTTPGALIADAEAAMYTAKERGRGRLELHDAKLRARVAARARIEEDLGRALARGSDELWVAYQPIHRPGGCGPALVEALGRWTHPELGPIPPSDFIPVAEECGLIADLGERILRESCEQVARWRERAPQLGLSVNVSARQIARLPDAAVSALHESGLPGSALWLELTEGVLLEDSEGTLEALGALRAMGARLVLDDFGTGYSSLGYLRRYPIDVLKIDRSFIADEPILAAIAAMARALGLATVAEGVETPDQLEHVSALGCDYVQGFYLAKPLPAAQLERLLVVGSTV